MATIRKRNSSYHVQVRRSGQPTITRSFKKRSNADAWARQTEAKIDHRGLAPSRTELEHFTVGDLLQRYLIEIVAHKRSKVVETQIIDVLLRHRMSNYALAHITPEVFRAFRDERMKVVKASTLRRQLCILQHAFNVAYKEWSFPIYENPVAAITKPTLGNPRNRRLEDGELEQLLKGCTTSRAWWLPTIIMFAIETGMRRGEIVNAQWVDVDFDTRTFHIPITKNGQPRTIPLSTRATDLLRELPSSDERIFPVTGNAVRLAWQRLKGRVGIDDLHFHDLRHEAISRFFEMGLSVPEVALISGHRDPRMLFRYTHLRAEDVGKKLK
jgi:integrase